MTKLTELNVEPGSLLILSGPPASGKSTFCKNNDIIPVSSDTLRINLFGVRGGRPSNLSDKIVFEVMESAVRERMRAGLLTVVDSTCVRDRDRKRFASIAEEYRAPVHVLIFDEPTPVLLERNRDREFPVPEDVIRKFKLKMDARSKWTYHGVSSDTKLSAMKGIPDFDLSPCDLIGDVHGLLSDMDALAVKMGYSPLDWIHPDGRTMVFLGDVVDRGPDSIHLLLKIKRTGHVLLCGNHERSLLKVINGGICKSKATSSTYHDYLMLPSDEERQEVKSYLESLPLYATGTTPDGERVLLSHAYLRDYDQFQTPTMDFLYGARPDVNDGDFGKHLKEVKPHGFTLHYHGHVPGTLEGNVVSLDTGAGFGGNITAVRLSDAVTLVNPEGSVL